MSQQLLMFERYCHLLHANRSRCLFGQIKQQKSYLAECERLKIYAHQIYLELNEQILLNKTLHLEIKEFKNTLLLNIDEEIKKRNEYLKVFFKTETF